MSNSPARARTIAPFDLTQRLDRLDVDETLRLQSLLRSIETARCIIIRRLDFLGRSRQMRAEKRAGARRGAP